MEVGLANTLNQHQTSTFSVDRRDPVLKSRLDIEPHADGERDNGTNTLHQK
jgi:hypothetical protein